MSEDATTRPSPLASRRWALIGVAYAATLATIPRPRPEVVTGPIALRVDPNTAPPAVLEALPKLGPVLAGRVVAAREVRPFDGLDDFDRRVRGIGPVTREALRPHLRFDGEPVPTKDR